MNYRIIFSLVAVVLILSGCTRFGKKIRYTGEAQGTYYAITYFDSQGRNFKPETDSLLKRFDLIASLWHEASLIRTVNRNDTVYYHDADFLRLLDLSKEVYESSGGAFDPTVGPLVNAWGFGFTDPQKIDSATVDSLMPLVGFDKIFYNDTVIIKSDPRIQLDFNAIAQGYSVDLVGDFLEKKGIVNYLIDIGGEVKAHGSKPDGPWLVGIEKPEDNAGYGEALQATVQLTDLAMATSGNYRKFYEIDGVRYSHTINPSTGFPVTHSLLSVTVVSENCALADAWATAFMVLGIDRAIEIVAQNPDVEAYFIFSGEDQQMKVYFSEGFKSILTD